MKGRAPGGVWNREFIVLFFLNSVNNLSFYLMISALVLYTKEELSWNAAMIGFFSGFYAVAALFCRPVAGLLSDRYGTRFPMLVGNVLMVASAVFYGIFRSFTALMVTRVIHGAAFSFTNTSMTSAVATSLPRDRLSEGIGYYGVAMILAQSIAPGLGLKMAAARGYDTVFFTSALLAAGATACLLLLIRPARVTEKPPFRLRLDSLVARECLGLAAVGATVSGTNGIFTTYMVLSAGEWGLSQAALSPFYWVNGAALIASRLINGWLSRRRESRSILFLALGLCAASLLVMLRCSTLAVLCLVGALKGLGTGIGIPTLQAMCYRRVTPERNGVATSTYYIGADVGNGLAPMITGEAVEMFGGGYDTAYIVNLVILAAGAAGVYGMGRRERKKGAE